MFLQLPFSPYGLWVLKNGWFFFHALIFWYGTVGTASISEISQDVFIGRYWILFLHEIFNPTGLESNTANPNWLKILKKNFRHVASEGRFPHKKIAGKKKALSLWWMWISEVAMGNKSKRHRSLSERIAGSKRTTFRASNAKWWYIYRICWCFFADSTMVNSHCSPPSGNSKQIQVIEWQMTLRLLVTQKINQYFIESKAGFFALAQPRVNSMMFQMKQVQGSLVGTHFSWTWKNLMQMVVFFRDFPDRTCAFYLGWCHISWSL